MHSLDLLVVFLSIFSGNIKGSVIAEKKSYRTKILTMNNSQETTGSQSKIDVFDHPYTANGVFWLLWLAACIPVFLPNELPLQDYPSHIARLYILHDGMLNETISAYFGVNWHFVANLALEIFTYPFVEVFPPDSAGRIFICASFLVLSSGTISVHRALGGKGYWPYLSFLFLYSDILVYGFIAFLFSCGLALWIFALWLKMRKSKAMLQLVLFTSLSLLLLVSHLFAFCFYALMLGSYEISRLIRRKKAGEKLINRSFLVGILQFIPAILLFIANSETADAATLFVSGSIKTKLSGMAALISFYNIKLQLALIWILGFVLYILRAKGKIKSHANMRIFLVLALIIFLVSPVKAFASFYLDYRMPSAFVFAALASVVTQNISRKNTRLYVGLLMTLCMAQYAHIGAKWVSYDASYEKLYEITEDLQEGDTLMHVTMSKSVIAENLEQPYAHTPSWLLISKNVITPYIFADPRHQPIYYKQDISRTNRSDYIDAIIPYQDNEKLLEEFDALNSEKFMQFKYMLLINFPQEFLQNSKVWQLQKSLGPYILYKNTSLDN